MMILKTEKYSIDPMTNFFYSLLIHFYKGTITLAALFNKKAKLKVEGIGISKVDIEKFSSKNKKDLVFIHCASQGEHEQALPIIRWIIQNTHYGIVLSFSSPSGYTHAKNDIDARLEKIYLPFDTPSEMSSLVSIIKPKIVIIIKNEWWWNLLHELKNQKVETFLVSATIRESHYFIKYPLQFFKKGLHSFSKIFVVDEDSKNIISKVYQDEVCVSRDTRIDQANYNKSHLNPVSVELSSNLSQPVIVYGSIWESDLNVVQELISIHPSATHLIYPHELDEKNIQKISSKIDKSKLVTHTREASSGINIITSMGELKFAYRLASMAYIGGGFGVGIHNILEAAVFEIPTLFGPNFQKSNEAKFLTDNNCAFPIVNASAVGDICKRINKESNRKEIETKLKSYFSPEYSPTEIICQKIFKKSEINV